MVKKTKSSTYFPYKNYLYLIMGIVIFLLLLWYAVSWIKVRNEEKLATSYLIKTNTVSYTIDDLNEINSVLSESPSEYFIYISYTGNEDIYKLEKKLKKVIDNYNLKDEFYYIDVTKIKDNDSLLNNLNKIFNTDKIVNIPCIIYYQNNEIKDIILDNKNIFDYNKFINLLKDNAYERAI